MEFVRGIEGGMMMIDQRERLAGLCLSAGHAITCRLDASPGVLTVR